MAKAVPFLFILRIDLYTRYMSERLYKGIQYSLTKSFKAVCLQKDILGETKAYSSGRKDAVVLCKQICKRTWSMKGNGEI